MCTHSVGRKVAKARVLKRNLGRRRPNERVAKPGFHRRFNTPSRAVTNDLLVTKFAAI